jgi:transcription antitermination factor NusG
MFVPESATNSTAATFRTQPWQPVFNSLEPEQESWVAIYTRQHHEKKVAASLASQSFDCYLPLYKSERKWSNHRSPVIQMPLFPTYLFVRTSKKSRTRILRTPGVIGIVGRGSNDDSISDNEIAMLRSGLHLRNPEPHDLAPGEDVEIAAGPLKGMRGTIVRCKPSLRVVITVPMIRQSVSVEVAASELEPVRATRAC